MEDDSAMENNYIINPRDPSTESTSQRNTTNESIILELSANINHNNPNNSPDEGLGYSSCASSNASSSFKGIQNAESLSVSIFPATPLMTSASVVPKNFENFELQSSTSSCSGSPNLIQRNENIKNRSRKNQKFSLEKCQNYSFTTKINEHDNTNNCYNMYKSEREDDLMSTSLNSNTTICSQITNSSMAENCAEMAKFSNWNDLFHFLKKEIVSYFLF